MVAKALELAVFQHHSSRLALFAVHYRYHFISTVSIIAELALSVPILALFARYQHHYSSTFIVTESPRQLPKQQDYLYRYQITLMSTYSVPISAPRQMQVIAAGRG